MPTSRVTAYQLAMHMLQQVPSGGASHVAALASEISGNLNMIED